MEVSVKQAAGIVLLGLAFAWLLGSMSLRALGFASCSIICAVGLIVATLPIHSDWESCQTSASDYDAAIADLRRAISNPWRVVGQPSAPPKHEGDIDLSAGLVPKSPDIDLSAGFVPKSQPNAPPQHGPWEKYAKRGTSALADNDKTIEMPESTRKWWRPNFQGDKMTVDFPGKMSEEEIMRVFQTQALLPRPSFSLTRAIVAHRTRVLGGLILSAVGLLSCAGLLRATLRAKRERPQQSA
jgi:hypothetical protein